MDDSNRIINALWCGEKITKMGMLCLSSFIQMGHIIHLYLYNKVINDLPKNCIVMDANSIISEKEVFSYTSTICSIIKNATYQGFSDLFRYKLLYEKGGWYVDMDVTCLKPFDINKDFVFRKHPKGVIGNIIKVPAKSQFMLNCYEEGVRLIGTDNDQFVKPIILLNEEFNKHNLGKHILKEFSNEETLKTIIPMVSDNDQLNSKWYAIHWCALWLIGNNIDLNAPNPNTVYFNLLKKYELV